MHWTRHNNNDNDNNNNNNNNKNGNNNNNNKQRASAAAAIATVGDMLRAPKIASACSAGKVLELPAHRGRVHKHGGKELIHLGHAF